MADVPPPRVILDLIELGRGEVERVPPSLSDESVASSALPCGPDQWLEATQRVTTDDLEALIRGVVLYARASGAPLGGSVSPVIWLYRIYVSREARGEPELTRWLVTHRMSPYEPFGSLNDEGALTYREFVTRQTARRLRAATNEAAEGDRQWQAHEQKLAREAGEATQRLAAAVRRGDLAAVQALLAKGADALGAIPDGGSLVDLAEAHGRQAVATFLRSSGIR